MSFNMEINKISEAEPANLTKLTKSPEPTYSENIQNELPKDLADIFDLKSPGPLIMSDTDSDMTTISQFFNTND